MTETFSAIGSRVSAQSTAESPPPTMTTFLSRKSSTRLAKVMNALAGKLVDAWRVQPFRLERADAAADDDRFAVPHRLVGRELENAVVQLHQIEDLLAETHIRLVAHRLLIHLLDQILGEDLRKAGNIVDVLFRVDGGQCAAWFFQGVDDQGTSLAHSRIEGREQAGRASANDRDVVDIALSAVGRYGHRIWNRLWCGCGRRRFVERERF